MEDEERASMPLAGGIVLALLFFTRQHERLCQFGTEKLGARRVIETQRGQCVQYPVDFMDLLTTSIVCRGMNGLSGWHIIFP